MGRARRFLEYASIAAIACLIPPLLWSEWTNPDPWGPRALPPRWQTVPFVALAFPPLWTANAVSPIQNGYGCAIGASGCGCWGYHPRPLRGAWEFWRVGFPFWLAVIVSAGELIARRRSRSFAARGDHEI
jgi:hypothetical protein